MTFRFRGRVRSVNSWFKLTLQRAACSRCEVQLLSGTGSAALAFRLTTPPMFSVLFVEDDLRWGAFVMQGQLKAQSKCTPF